MCVRTYLLPTTPEFKQKDKGPANPKRKKKCQMTSPPSFNLVVISNGIFAEHKKEGPLNPLRISPRFLVELQAADKGDP